MPDKQLTMVSLFSGCGGMDLGFKKAGVKILWANDMFKEAVETYRNNVSENIVYGDITKIKNEDIPNNPDIITGGFPCQGFSIANTNRSMADERNFLYKELLRIIDNKRPKFFIAENVKGLVNLGDVKDIIQQDFASADGNGYIVLPPQVLHAGNYGVPESRERVIFIGIRRDALRPEALHALEADEIPDEYNPYPKPTHAGTLKDGGLLPMVTTYDILKDLEEPEDSLDESQKVYSKAKYLSNGSQGQIEIKLDGLGPTIRSEHHGNIEFRRLSAEHGGKHFDELEVGLKERRLTPRECALIQTFPPDYRFVIKKTTGNGYHISSSGAYKIIGNAVPPVLAYHIATRLEDLWPKYFVE